MTKTLYASSNCYTSLAYDYVILIVVYIQLGYTRAYCYLINIHGVVICSGGGGG